MKRSINQFVLHHHVQHKLAIFSRVVLNSAPSRQLSRHGPGMWVRASALTSQLSLLCITRLVNDVCLTHGCSNPTRALLPGSANGRRRGHVSIEILALLRYK